MPKFLIYTAGAGEGCDYTIGCNLSVDVIEADDINHAYKKWAAAEIEMEETEFGQYFHHRFDDYDSVIIYEIKDEKEIDLNMLKSQYNDANAKYETAEKRAKLERELEKLK